MIKFLKEPIKKQMRKTGMVRELEIEKKNLRNQIGNLNSQLNNLKTENCNLKKIITNLESEKIELKHGLSNFIEMKFNPLKNDNNNLKKENHVLKDQLKNAISVNQKFLSERSELVAQLSDRVSKLEKENHVLDDQLKNAISVNQKFLSERSELVAQLSDRVSDLKRENHVLDDQLKKAISVNQKFLSERSELVAQLSDRVSDLKRENHVLDDQLKKTQAKNQNLKERKKSLRIENQKLLSERTGIVGYSLKSGLRGMSTDAGKPAIIKYILETVDKNSKVLDVGFGSGVYGKLLRAFLYQNIDGVDVYEDNIKEMGLDKIYDKIHIKNILDFDFEYYDLIIMGDVLEHIELESSKKLLSGFIKNNKCGNIIVSIPYEYKQGEAYGNPYEKHLQPNANKEYMEEHYPYLQLIDSSSIPRRGGIMATYVWNKYMPHIE